MELRSGDRSEFDVFADVICGDQIIQYHEAQGAVIFNPHTYLLEDGGMKSVDMAQLRFKEKVDPLGLLNPGKMRAWNERWVEG